MKTLNLKTLGIGIAFGIMTTILAQWALLREPEKQLACKEYPDNITRINLATLLEETARYGNTHAVVVKGDMPANLAGTVNEPARAFHLPLEELKAFIYQIEIKSKKNADSLGINFIYTVYPQGMQLNNHDVGSLHTLALVPTRWDSLQWKEFDPITNFTIETLLNSYDPTGINFLGYRLANLSNSASSGPLMRNQGGLCPCPSGGGLCPCPNTILQKSMQPPYVGIHYK